MARVSRAAFRVKWRGGIISIWQSMRERRTGARVIIIITWPSRGTAGFNFPSKCNPVESGE